MNMKTRRVILRRPEPADAGRIQEYLNNPEVAGQLGGFRPAMAMQDVLDWIEHHRKRIDEIIWTIAERKTSACIGHVGLYQLDPRLQVGELAICIGAKTWWGKGLGKEVATAVIEYAFNELHLEQLRLSVLETNPRAIRLYEGLGFRRDGRLRRNQFRNGRYLDSLLMSLLKSEWKPKAK